MPITTNAMPTTSKHKNKISLLSRDLLPESKQLILRFSFLPLSYSKNSKTHPAK